MSSETTVSVLESLNAQVLALDSQDKDAIIEIGARLQEVAALLATAPDDVVNLLDQCLGTLQGMHEGRFAVRQQPHVAVAGAISAVSQWLCGQADGQTPNLQQARSRLSEFADPAAAGSEPQPAPSAEKVAQCAPPPEQVPSARLNADVDLDILKEFIAESLDHVGRGEAALLNLESNGQDREEINVIFRAFHTIKGTAGFLGLEHVQRLAHLAENLLDRAREGQLRITGGYADLALKSCDMLRTLIEGLKDAQPGVQLPTSPELGVLLAQLADPQAAGISEDASAQPMRLGEILVGQGAVSKEQLDQALQSQGAEPIGQALVNGGAAQAAQVGAALRVQKQQAQLADGTIRVSTGRLDSLVNIVGELVIAHSMVAQDPNIQAVDRSQLCRNVSHVSKIIRQLQDLGMSLRMVPLKATFQKMARLVRDLSHKAGKSVQLLTDGDETEIDRNMVEALNDPLVHMIRNSVDHGIEPTAARAEAGKNPMGTVHLRAYQSAGNVVIEVSDDGKGLDRQKILKKGKERGLIADGRNLSDPEIFGLIFLPGFSTADKVTDVSGRGVGMDVVKKGIESLRGRIDTTSAAGAGTTFRLSLPLTMAITDAMLLKVGNNKYLLPTTSIEHSFRAAAGTVSSVTGKGETVLLRGKLLPLQRLHRLFNVPDAQQDPYQGLLVVIEQSGNRCALLVDQLLGQHQVVIKSLGRALGQVAGIAGGAILGDGRVGLILDAGGILKLATAAAGAGSSDRAAATELSEELAVAGAL